MTKTQFHEEICASMGDFEAEYYAFKINEKAVDWFPDVRLAHDGYTENDSTVKDFMIVDDDLPF
jgi:hypothetical protein